MDDALEIMNLLAGFGLNADLREWDAVLACFATQLDVDYRSLNGSPKQTIAASALVNNWRDLLPGFSRTQHMIALPMINVRGDRAAARASFVAYHFIDGLPTESGDRWIVGGRYEWGLAKTSGTWKIDSLLLADAWQDGNRNLPALAMQRVQDAKKSS